ncbi:hypothetical protein PsorP6_003968 [Peronosclerospora sorghi]|uniref:Uncharacterized protein n=1 Tax=Peronosclerospora sorghi TaxID=230839 RepID=A0ACC0VQC9_9STRA|nr:hypothetical protein PsorP6_003968 [Peronosclerospora sorghi]
MTTYVELCACLSRFLQHEPSDALNKELQKILDDLLMISNRIDDKVAIDSSLLLPLTTIDDLVLLSLNKLLSSFVLKSSSQTLKESSFKVFLRLLRRSRFRMNGNNIEQGSRRLSFIQNCVLYLPTPPAAAHKDDEMRDSVNLSTQSEELRIVILQCLWELLEGREQELVLQFQVDQQDLFAYIVASLLHVAERDRCQEAALQAVDVLKRVLFFIRDAVTLRQYLPGIAAGLSKTANAPQQASRVIVAALQCLATALDLCLGDDHLQRQEKDKQTSFTLEAIRQSIKVADAKKNNKADDTVRQNSNDNEIWLEKAAVNLDVLLSRMFAASLTSAVDGSSTRLPRSSWRVRCAIAQLCGTVMLRCQQVLCVSFFRCYDELLVLRGDAIAEVAQEADTVLQQLQLSALSSEKRLRLLPEMADRFQMLLSTLVLKLATEHEVTKMNLVRTIRGYVAVLGSSFSPYLDMVIESIYTSLCRVVSFAALDIELEVHQALPRPAESSEKRAKTTSKLVVSQFQKRLRYFNEEASVSEVLAMLRDIGAISTPAGFIDCAFTLLSEANTIAGGAEIMLVLNEFLRAYCPNNNSETPVAHKTVDVYLIGRILEDLLALDAWSEHGLSSSNGSSRAPVSQRALMVECVGVCAEIMCAEFKVFLLHVLYSMVEQLGSTSVEVERAALAALEKVYFFTGYDSLEALFQANMDYFVDALCARLEQLDMFPMTAFVVEALLRHTRLESLPLVNEVASSLLHSVDLYQDSSHIGGLLRALKKLLESIAHDTRASDGARVQTVGDDEQKKPMTSYELLSAFIHEMKVLESDGTDALEIEPDNEEERRSFSENVENEMPPDYGKFLAGNQNDPSEDEGGEIPTGNVAVVIDIMDRCGYFLVDSDPIACCLVLSLIEEGVRFLAQHPKQLLPLVARMWPELLPRLRVKNRAIVTNTIRVITVLVETVGDFVGDRFVKTVWPILQSQLQAIFFDTDVKPSLLTRSMLLLPKSSIEIRNAVDVPSPGLDVETRSSGGKEMSGVNGIRKTQEIRMLLVILSCLTSVCQQSETVTQLVPEISRICCKYLSSSAPREVVEQTSELFAALVQLNGDEVFCTLAALVEWVPPPPPSARFSAYEVDAARHFYRGHLSDLGEHVQFCRENARVLMNRHVPTLAVV